MEWFETLFVQHSALQAVVVLSLVCAVGLSLGHVKICGVSLGITFIFFTGILAGHFGFSLDPAMLDYAESFGLVVFVYALGLQVGPGFFSSFRRGGTRQITVALGVVVAGTLLALGLGGILHLPMADVAGVLCGATTNTPALGAAQQTLALLGAESASPALSCALTYPFGVVGVILAMIAARRWFVRPADVPTAGGEPDNGVFIASFEVTNPAAFGRSLRDIARHGGHKFVVSRLWRGGAVTVPTSETILAEGDRLLAVTSDAEVEALTLLFGRRDERDWNKKDIDWNAVDAALASRRIVITRPDINGRRLGALRLRNQYGVSVSRVYRSGVQLLATSDLTLQLGDRLTVVGEVQSLERVEKLLGNAVKDLDEPNLVAVFVGLVLGLLLGAIPFSFPGVSVPVKLGLAGGPILVGILIGTFGPRLHMITYTTQSANRMLRALGISLYLACLGLDAGAHFFETVVRPEGLIWLGTGALVTFVPTLLMALVSLRWGRLDFGSTCGVLCGSMANPMALDYASASLTGDKPAVSYATVYPLCMFLRVVIVQVILMIFI